MNIIPSSYEFDLDAAEGKLILGKIEKAGRTCYRSEDNNKLGDFEKTKKFIKMLIERGHESVLEHEKMTVRIICDRGVSHELVRHRLASYSQESTRYCCYAKDRFNNELTFIDLRHFLPNPEARKLWEIAMQQAETNYLELVNQHGVPAQFARSILPNSLKTEIAITANIREWRHIFKLRTSKAAHPQMQEIMGPLLQEFQELIPVVFDDIEVGG
jgi:thymidylate synthase (FAD)